MIDFSHFLKYVKLILVMLDSPALLDKSEVVQSLLHSYGEAVLSAPLSSRQGSAGAE